MADGKTRCCLTRLRIRNATDRTKQARFDCSAVSTNTTRVVHLPNAEGWIADQDTSIAAAPTFAGLNVPTGAAVGYVLTCDNATTGRYVAQPSSGIAMLAETVTSTPYTMPQTSAASEIVANPVSETFHITLPLLNDTLRRVVLVRNRSGSQSIVVHAQSGNSIWTSGRTELTLPPDSFTRLEASVDNGLWLPA